MTLLLATPALGTATSSILGATTSITAGTLSVGTTAALPASTITSGSVGGVGGSGPLGASQLSFQGVTGPAANNAVTGLQTLQSEFALEPAAIETPAAATEVTPTAEVATAETEAATTTETGVEARGPEGAVESEPRGLDTTELPAEESALDKTLKYGAYGLSGVGMVNSVGGGIVKGKVEARNAERDEHVALAQRQMLAAKIDSERTAGSLGIAADAARSSRPYGNPIA